VALILVMCDEATMRRACAEGVRRAGLRERVVRDVQAAIRALLEEDFDALVVHAVAPGELAALMHVSLHVRLPPVALITDLPEGVSVVATGGTRSIATEAIGSLLRRLLFVIEQVDCGSAVKLPLRLVPTASKWTRRLFGDDPALGAFGDGATSDDLHLGPALP
jgi:hypothetical protein